MPGPFNIHQRIVDKMSCSWHCDEVSGDLVESMSGRHGVANGSPSSEAGKINNARLLDRYTTNDYFVVAGANPQINTVPGGSFCGDMLFKLGTLDFPDTASMIRCVDGFYVFLQNTSGAYRVTMGLSESLTGGGYQTIFIDLGDIAGGTIWNWLYWHYDRQNSQMFLRCDRLDNGVGTTYLKKTVGPTALTNPHDTPRTNALYIGSMSGITSWSFPGAIDEIHWYNRDQVLLPNEQDEVLNYGKGLYLP